MESWFSLQTVLDIIVGSLVVYFMYGRLKAIAKPADRKKGNVIKPKQSESDDEALTAKVKIVKDDNTITVSYTHLDVYKRQRRGCAIQILAYLS